MNDDDLTAELQRLPRSQEPPAHVRTAVAAQLRAHSKRTRTRQLWRGSAAAAVLVAVFLAGRFSAPVPASPTPSREYALLLYGGESDDVAGDRVREYGAWAARLRRDGRAISGERLEDDSWTVGVNSTALSLRGFFIIEARDADDAVSLARAHPHTKYGGAIVVRPVGR